MLRVTLSLCVWGFSLAWIVIGRRGGLKSPLIYRVKAKWLSLSLLCHSAQHVYIQYILYVCVPLYRYLWGLWEVFVSQCSMHIDNDSSRSGNNHMNIFARFEMKRSPVSKFETLSKLGDPFPPICSLLLFLRHFNNVKLTNKSHYSHGL